MKRLFIILGLLVGISQAQTTTTITGTIKDLTQALVTSGKVTFTLQPSRDTTISGLARFSPAQVVCLINASGLIKAQDGTSVCTLTMNTALNPPGTYYRVDVWPFNVKTSSFTFYAVLSTYDWSTVVPTPATSPFQNFVDVISNQTIGGNKTFTGNLTLQGTVLASGGISTSALNNVVFVGAGVGDIGAQINAAYAALPANGGLIVVTPKADNSCYAFTTPIVANVSGKYLLLEGELAGGSTAGCLNFTSTTGSAITLDFVPVGGAGARGGVYGIRDLWLTNNLCTSIGGCGGSVTGISVTNTNDGIDGAFMQNVTIQGFTVGYGENAHVPSSEVQWLNPRIYNNGVGMNLFATAEEQILGGTFYGNGNHIQSGDATSQPEIHITGTYFVAHSNEAFAFTNTSLGGTIYLTDVHLENGANITSNAHYVEGNVNIFGKGGVAEDDSSSGTSDWWFNPNGLAFIWDGLQIVTASRNPTIGVLDLAANTRAKLTGFVINPSTLTSIVGGANAAKATVCMLSGDITHAASTCAMEAPIQTPALRVTSLLLSNTAPTISSGFGTSPSIVQQNGTAAFEINVGTGGVATSGVIGLPTATNGWTCTAIDMNTNVVTRETAFSTTSVTLTAASAWTASDKLLMQCGAF